MNPCFCNRASLSICTPVLRYGMPYLRLSDCHVAALLAMTPKRGVFIWKTDVFHFCGYFLRGIAPHRLSNVLFRKLFRFPAKPISIVIARRARAPDAAIFNEAICHSVTKYVRAERCSIVISIPFCYVLPCFATGCHTIDFKIATAALRPRNDTKLRRFWVKIAYFARILRVLRSRQRRSAARSATDAACPLRVLRSRQRRRGVGRVSSQGISRFLPNFRRLHFAHTML